MGTISRTTINTGDVLTTAQWNAQFDTAYTAINGNLDADNLADDAVETAKIADDNVTGDKLADDLSLANTQTLGFEYDDHALVAGNNDDIAFGGVFRRITGAAGAITITGIAGGADGRYLILYNSTAQNLTIGNEDANSLAANRIITLTGADVVLATANGHSAMLIYSDADSRWILLNAWGA